MITIRQVKPVRFRPAVALRREDEPVVKNGLALTPAAMVEMMNQGMPISAQGYSIKDESIAQANDFFVPAEYTRGFDMVDGWNFRQEVHEKLRRVRKDVKSGKIPILEGSQAAANS